MSMQETTGNPAFRALGTTADWVHARGRAAVMTVQGTALKTLVLLAILMATAAWSWIALGRGDLGREVFFGALIAGLVLGLVTCFRPALAPYTAPLYAAAEGVFLGAISCMFDRAYEGIVVNAASLTMTTLFVMLVLYSNRWVRVTDRLRTGIVAATGAVMLVYVIAMLMNLFGYNMPYIHDAGPIGIAFSLFVVGLAAFNLLLDFDFIEQGSARGLPRTMEWYGAFGLLVTLVWLYLEVLKLLRKLQSRD